MPASQIGRKKRPMSWSEFDDLLSNLEFRIKNEMIDEKGVEVGAIAGIFRGGIILARCLAARLKDAPLIILKKEHDDGNSGLKCLGDVNIQNIRLNGSKTLLLVDDISDTGDTFKFFVSALKKLGIEKLFTASLILKKYSIFYPDFYGLLDSSKDWIVFPWES
ncbi:MAG: phosphoribosyltransferase [Promethearchaeota archaeon]